MNNLSELESKILKIESKFKEAISYKYRNSEEIIKKYEMINPILQMDIKRFYELYLDQNKYPIDRISKLIDNLLDIKMQLYFINEVDLGLYNSVIFPFLDDNPVNSYIVLKKLSFDQNLIVKNRILWERIMNFIYFLEVGKDLKSKRSKREKFFKFIEKETKWKYLLDFKDFINWYEDNLRTPEVHQGSKFRKYFINNEISNPNLDERKLGIASIVMNVFYNNLLIIIQGREVTSLFKNSAMNFNSEDDSIFFSLENKDI